MEAYATDIGNAYLEAKTREKVCITNWTWALGAGGTPSDHL